MELFWIGVHHVILELTWFLVQQFGSCKTLYFFLSKELFFVFVYSNEHRGGDGTRSWVTPHLEA